LAFIGTGSAGAKTLCHLEPGAPGSGGCPAGELPYTGSLVAHNVGDVTLLAFATVECAVSLLEGKITNAGSATTNPKGVIEKMTFSSCSCGGNAATAESLNLSWNAELLASATLGNGLLDVTNPRGLFVACFNHCIYTAGTATATFLGHSTTASGLTTVDALITLSRVALDFFCPATAVWHGVYTTLPNDLDLH